MAEQKKLTLCRNANQKWSVLVYKSAYKSAYQTMRVCWVMVTAVVELCKYTSIWIYWLFNQSLYLITITNNVVSLCTSHFLPQWACSAQRLKCILYHTSYIDVIDVSIFSLHYLGVVPSYDIRKRLLKTVTNICLVLFSEILVLRSKTQIRSEIRVKYIHYFPNTCFSIVFIQCEDKNNLCVCPLRIEYTSMIYTMYIVQYTWVALIPVSSECLYTILQKSQWVSWQKKRLIVHSKLLDGSCSHSLHSIYLLIWHLNHIIAQKLAIFSAQVEHIMQYSIP